MRFLIVGYGRVGSRTARVLREEGHRVTVVETDATKVDRARDSGFDVVAGDGSDETILSEAGIDQMDAVAALTGEPNVNFEICLVGKDFGCRTVMRISEDFRSEVYDEYETTVDEVIYPERLGAAGAKTALLGGDFNALGDLTEGLQLTTLTVGEDAPINGQRIADISVGGARIYAHGAPREPLTIPMPGETASAGDRLALIVETDRLEEVRAALLG